MIARELKLKTGFARKAARGRGVGVHEAVAAAEARIEDMRGEAMEKVAALIESAQAARPAIAQGDPAAFVRLQDTADALVGLCGPFGLSEVGSAAFSLCALLDAAKPGVPGADAVRVHLDAILLFWSSPPEVRAASATSVLAGLKRVATLPGRKGVD